MTEVRNALHEHSQESIVHTMVMLRVKNGQQDQTNSAGDREKNRPNRARLVESAFVPRELPGMSEPALSEQTQVHEDDSYHAADNEQRFQSFGSNVRDVPGFNFSLCYQRLFFFGLTEWSAPRSRYCIWAFRPQPSLPAGLLA
jgi:hypothetical protein